MGAADGINAALAALAGCLCDALVPKICACGLTVGDEFVEIGIEDFECEEEECGQAWVRVIQAYPTTTLGQQDLDPGLGCDDAMMGLDLEIGVLRCIELADEGEPMDLDELLRASQQQMDDMIAMKNAFLCCDHFEDRLIGNWQQLGPLGGQIGGFWTVNVMI